MDKDWGHEIRVAGVHQGFLSHAALASKGKLPKFVDKVLYGLALLLLCAQQGMLVDFEIILKEARGGRTALSRSNS